MLTLALFLIFSCAYHGGGRDWTMVSRVSSNSVIFSLDRRNFKQQEGREVQRAGVDNKSLLFVKLRSCSLRRMWTLGPQEAGALLFWLLHGQNLA